MHEENTEKRYSSPRNRHAKHHKKIGEKLKNCFNTHKRDLA